MNVAAIAAGPNARARRTFAQLAAVASLLTLVVIVASAFIRHSQAGLSCSDWPACYGAIHETRSAETAVAVARILHRLAATGALIVVVGVWLAARARRPAFGRVRTLALATLLVAAALGALGVATPGAAIPAVPFGNLIGGFLMLALLAALAATAIDNDVASHNTPTGSCRRLALALLVVTFLQAGAGALIGVRFALPACAELVHCSGSVANGPSIGAALDLLQPVAVVDGRVVPPGDAATLHVVHRLLATAVTLLALALAWRLRAVHARAALSLAILALASPLLGITAVVAMPALAVSVLHNAAAALLVATLAYVAAAS